MKRKIWKEADKFKVVLEGLRAEMSVAELCNRHELHQSQYYKWQDQFLKNGAKAFEGGKQNHRERLLENKVARMERVIGALTLELKKND